MPRSNASRWFTRLLARARSWIRDLSNRSLAVCLAVGVFASLVMLLRPPVLFDFLWEQDNHLQDRFFGWRDSLARVLNYEPMRAQEITIVSIDSESARRLGMSPPWPRQMYAELLRKLKQAGASVVAFDLIFDGPSPLSESASGGKADTSRRYAKVPESASPGLSKSWVATSGGDDLALAESLKAMNNVVLATDVEVSTSLFAGRSKLLFHTPHQPFVLALESGTASLGNLVIEPDKDGIVRKADLVFSEFRHLNPFFFSFGLRIAEKKLQTRAVQGPGGNLYFYERIYPPSFRINYIGPSGSIKAVPFWQAIDWERHYGPKADASGKAAQKDGSTRATGNTNPFQDKIVLVGFHQYQAGDAAERFSRARSLPFDSFLTPGAGIVRPMSGVELQANIVANILTARYLSEPEWWEHVLIIMFVALLFARIFAGLHGKPWSMLSAVFLFALIWLVDAFLCFAYLNCLIPVMVPIFGVAFPAYFLVVSDQNLFAFRERRRHTRLFRSLASDRLASEIDRRVLGELGLEGKRATVTSLVCQLHDLNLIAASKSPEVVISMVNQCLREIIASVYEYHGIVNRVSSQGVQALWGAPIAMKEESQARLAANCFLDINRRLSEVTDIWRRDGLISSLDAGVAAQFGINTGMAVCGQIGTDTHSEYGALGEGIDLAVKLESTCSQYSSSCLVGEATAELTAEQFELRELDKVKLDASGGIHRIYGLICHKGKLPGALEEAIAIYKQGLAAIEERNFSEAERLFNTALRVVPDDGPAILMRDRCRHFLDSPPEPNWDGATLVATE